MCHGPKGWGPEGWGPEISCFFSVSPPVSLFLSLTVCLLVVFCGVWKRWGLQMCTFRSSRAVTCTFEGPGLHKTKIQREDDRERQKERNWWWEMEEKREILGGLAEGRPAVGGVCYLGQFKLRPIPLRPGFSTKVLNVS